MWEYISYGGGDLYMAIFNATALMSGASAMQSLIRLALVLGVCIALVGALKDFNIGAMIRWYIFAVVIYGVLWVPKVGIQVEDRLNPTAVYSPVMNVPIGAAVPAALISQVGDEIIQLTQTAFADPANSNFSDHGMVFGAKMFSKINAIRPADQLVALNMSSYMKNCALYDIQDNTVKINDLQTSADMWGTLTANPNPGRAGPYTNADGSLSMDNCQVFATQVTTDMHNDLTNVQKLVIATIDHNTPEAAMNSEEDGVSSMLSTALGSSQDSLNILSQAVTRNMLKDSLNMGTGSGSGSAIASAMAEVQTQNTQRLLGDVAEKAVVNLKIVIELLFIGIFPAIFPLMLLPKIGPNMAKGYLAGFFYLQLWGPMYVVLHKIMMWNDVNHMQQATFQPGGTHIINALSLDAVAQANQDVCALAGSMMLMIPVLAGLLTKGAMAVGQQGEALLGNFRSGAESASAMQTTGNYSFDNVSIGNASWDNANAHQHVTSPYNDTERSTVVGADGVTRATYSSGYETAKMDLSSGALNLNQGNVAGATMRKTSQDYLDDAESLSTAASVGASRATNIMSEISSGRQLSDATTQGLSDSENASVNQAVASRENYVQDLQRSYGMSREEAEAQATAASASVYAEGHVGTPSALPAGASAGIKAEASKSATSTGTESAREAKSAELRQQMQHDTSQAWDKVASTQAQSAYNHNTDSFSGTRHATSDTFASMASITDTASRMKSAGHRIGADAENYKSATQAMSTEEFQQFYQWGKTNGISGQQMNNWMQGKGEDSPEFAAALNSFWGQHSQSLADKYMQAPTPQNSAAATGLSTGMAGMLPTIDDKAMSAAMAKREGGADRSLSFDGAGVIPTASTIQTGGQGPTGVTLLTAPAHGSSPHGHPATGHAGVKASGHDATPHEPAANHGLVHTNGGGEYGSHVPPGFLSGFESHGQFGTVNAKISEGDQDKAKIEDGVKGGFDELSHHKIDTKQSIVGAVAHTAHKVGDWGADKVGHPKDLVTDPMKDASDGWNKNTK